MVGTNYIKERIRGTDPGFFMAGRLKDVLDEPISSKIYLVWV
jgi:hypothetical protein